MDSSLSLPNDHLLPSTSTRACILYLFGLSLIQTLSFLAGQESHIHFAQRKDGGNGNDIIRQPAFHSRPCHNAAALSSSPCSRVFETAAIQDCALPVIRRICTLLALPPRSSRPSLSPPHKPHLLVDLDLHVPRMRHAALNMGSAV